MSASSSHRWGEPERLHQHKHRRSIWSFWPSRHHLSSVFSPELSFHTDLLQFVRLGLILVTVSILSVGQTKGPHWQDAVHIVSDPGIRVIWTSREETRHWILLRIKLHHNKHVVLRLRSGVFFVLPPQITVYLILFSNLIFMEFVNKDSEETNLSCWDLILSLYSLNNPHKYRSGMS